MLHTRSESIQEEPFDVRSAKIERHMRELWDLSTTFLNPAEAYDFLVKLIESPSVDSSSMTAESNWAAQEMQRSALEKIYSEILEEH